MQPNAGHLPTMLRIYSRTYFDPQFTFTAKQGVGPTRTSLTPVWASCALTIPSAKRERIKIPVSTKTRIRKKRSRETKIQSPGKPCSQVSWLAIVRCSPFWICYGAEFSVDQLIPFLPCDSSQACKSCSCWANCTAASSGRTALTWWWPMGSMG